MVWPRVRRVLAGSAIGLGLAYAALIPGMYFAQRGLIFPAPQHFAAIPEGYREIAFSTADGLNLKAVWKPPGQGRPVVLFLHGNGDSWAGAAAANRLFAEAGYGVLLAEYRGYGDNPGEPSEQGLYADARGAMDWLKSQGFKADQVAVIGNSIGSGPATQLAREQRVGALVLVSPFASLPDLVAEKFPWLPARWLVEDRFDNAAKLAAIGTPVLVIHGQTDTLIPEAHARRLAAVAPRARLVLIPGFGHDLAYADAAQRIELEWLDQALAR